jgi:hypothetical protein
MTAKHSAPGPEVTTLIPIPEPIANANGHHKPKATRGNAWAELMATFAELAPLADQQALEILLGTVHAQRSDGVPVWLVLHSPPGNGKTLLLDALPAIAPPTAKDNPITDGRSIIALDYITPQTLMSGLANTERPGLLERVSSAVLVVKDMSPLTTSIRVREVFAQLRRVYDGELNAVFGSGKNSAWSGRLTLICASVSPPWSLDAELGARLLTVTMTRNEFAAQLASGSGRAKMQAKVKALLEGALPSMVDAATRDAVTPYADALASARAFMKRDRRQRNEIVELPIEEAPHRIAGQLASLAASVASLNGGDKQSALAAVRRVTSDSLQPERRHVLACLAASPDGVSTNRIVRYARERTGYKVNKEMVRRAAEELSMLNLVNYGDDDNIQDDDEALSATVQDYGDNPPEVGTGKRGRPEKLITPGARWRLFEDAPGLLKAL